MSAPSDERQVTVSADRSGGRRGYLVAASVLAVAAVGGGAALFVANGDSGPAARRPAAPTATAEITRGDLVDTESVDGRLTYAGERELPSSASGVVTWLPAEGATVARGKPLLAVDGEPVTLMYGSLPLYRTLREGVEDGKDVEQLERNLEALGHGGDLTVDEEFTAATTAAVKAWQEDVGLPESGAVDARQVVFQAGAVRVGELHTAVGGRVGPGGQPMKVTGTGRIVHVDLPADKQDMATKGATVSVELPGGTRVEGRIARVGTVAEQADSGGEPGQETDPTVDVEITLAKGARTGRLDQAPVTVELESERRKNVLSVPIEALLALREGGFGIEVVDGGTPRVVAVETGTYGGGRVEITGTGLREGMKVGVPAE
ncbi:MAG: peptidoglycan-binding protein [Actinomadura sp.]